MRQRGFVDVIPFRLAGRPFAAELEVLSKTHTNLWAVGEIGAFTIYDLEYFFGGDESDPGMRSVLVETTKRLIWAVAIPVRVLEVDEPVSEDDATTSDATAGVGFGILRPAPKIRLLPT